jgi:hypothetical protein
MPINLRINLIPRVPVLKGSGARVGKHGDPGYEYAAQIWHGSLTEEQSIDIERIQKRAMKIICPGKTYELALIKCGIKTLENRRETMCINLIKDE